MPTALDFAYLAFLLVLITLVEGFVYFPRFKAEVAAGVPGARVRGYRRTTRAQWIFAGIVVLAWIVTGRPWADLGLVPPTGWRLWVGVLVVAAIAAQATAQRRAVSRLPGKPEAMDKYRARLADVEFLLPHARDEYRGFTILSITAGVCEELLCRGYLMWALRPFMPVAAAIALSAVIFGLGHAYQGRKGIVKTGLVGVVMNLIVLATGWLIPAMVVHAVVDAGAGQLAYVIYRRDPEHH